MPWVDRFKCTLHNGNFLPVGFKVVQNFTTAMSLSLFGRTLNSVLNAKSSNLLRQKFKTSNRYKRNSVLNKLTFLQSHEWTKKLQKLSHWLEVFQCVLCSGTEALLYGKLCFRHTIGQFAVRKLLYGPKLLKKMLISELQISLPRKQGLNKVIRRLSTFRTWMLTLAFNILNCVYLWTKAMKKLTRNLIEEDSSQCLKILSHYTVKKTKIDWQRFETLCLTENKRLLR